MQRIFYGAGSHAERNIQKWIEKGDIPVCFADRDIQKQGKKLHGIDIFSLQEAVKRFPDHKIVITVDRFFKDVYDTIVASGIPEKRIEFIVPREYRRGCRFLGRFWQYQGGVVCSPCCYEHGYVARLEGGFIDHYAMFLKLNDEILQGFKMDRPTSCDGCREIAKDWWEVQPKLNCVSLATGFHGDICNAKCIYCNSQELLKNSKNANVSTLDACKGLAQVTDIEDLSIIFNNGEFSVNPDRAEIMRIWEENRWHGSVLTNAVEFEPRLAKMMEMGLAEINCSLDAGTQGTFKKVKGIDRFDRVCDALERYSQSGRVTLKYIMLKGINDGLDDINGFVGFARKIRARVLISRDNTLKTKLTDEEIGVFRHFVAICKENDLVVDSPLDVFNEQDFYIMKELL